MQLEIPKFQSYNNTPLMKSGAFNLNNIGFDKIDEEDLDKFDMSAIFEKVKADFTTGLPRDLKVDTSDCAKAENFMHWITDPRFTNQDTEMPWSRQIRYIMRMLGEICTNPKCSDLKFLEEMPVDASIDQMRDKLTFLKFGKCPSCHLNKFELEKEHGLRHYTSAILILGQRSGKTKGTNWLYDYYFANWLRLQRPQKIYSVSESQSIEFSFTATVFSKALKNLFEPLLFNVRNGPWYKSYHEILDHYGRVHGEELYKILDHSLIYRHNKYHVYAESPNPQNMRGATRASTAIDELDHLFAKDKGAVRLNPDEVYNSLENSLLTLRMAYNKLAKQGVHNVPCPIMPTMTSPRTFNSIGMRLLRDSQSAKSLIYGEHGSVYDYNPNAKDDPDLADKARRNPGDFKRDFLAIPPNAANAFITNIASLQQCIIADHSNGIKTKDEHIPTGKKGIKLLGASYQIIKNKKVDLTTPKVLTIDAGKNKNSFAICIAHNETIEEDDFEHTIRIVDAVGEVIPRDGYDLSHPSIVSELIYPLIEEFNVKAFFADRWNSLQLTQQIMEDFEIESSQYSLKYNDFLEFRQAMLEGDLGFPMAEGIKIKDLFTLSSENYPMCFHGKPIAHFFFQCLTVEDIMNKTVDKGTGYTDDIFRAVVLAHWALNNDEIAAILEEAKQPVNKSQGFVGAVGSLSGGTMVLGGGMISGAGGLVNGKMQGTNGAVAAIGSFTPYGGGR